MTTILQYTPGSVVTVVLQTLNDLGIREDGYSTPVIERVILPDLSESSLYPLDMIRIDVGFFYHRFTIPSNAISVGSYLVDISWTNAANDPKQDIVQIICSPTSGNFSVSPG